MSKFLGWGMNLAMRGGGGGGGGSGIRLGIVKGNISLQ